MFSFFSIVCLHERTISFEHTLTQHQGFNLCALTVLYSMANVPYSPTIHTDVSYQFLYFTLHIVHYESFVLTFLRIKVCKNHVFMF